MFKLIARANGNEVKGHKNSKPSKELPKADFNTIAAFIGAM